MSISPEKVRTVVSFYFKDIKTYKKLQDFSEIVQNTLYRRFIESGNEGVFIVTYLRPAGLAQHNRDDIEAAGTVLDMLACEEISGGSGQSCFFDRCYGILDIGEFFIRLCSYLDKDNTAVGIDHNQVYLAGLAPKITSEDFEAFSFEEFFAAFFSPSAEQLAVG